MPKVNGRSYPYTDKGKAAAKKAKAKKKPMKTSMASLAKGKTSKKATKKPLASKFKKLARRGNID